MCQALVYILLHFKNNTIAILPLRDLKDFYSVLAHCYTLIKTTTKANFGLMIDDNTLSLIICSPVCRHTEQKPWAARSPVAQIMDLVMGTSPHLRRHARSVRRFTPTSWSLSGKVLLSPMSPQPAVLHWLDLLSLPRAISCTSLVRLALRSS